MADPTLLVDYLRNGAASGRILVWGDSTQIYLHSRRLPGSRFYNAAPLVGLPRDAPGKSTRGVPSGNSSGTRTVQHKPSSGAPALAVEVWDSTGGITALFYGRRSIAGIAPGSKLQLAGMVGEANGHLAMAMIHEIIANGLYDEDFVQNYCLGLDELKTAAAAYPAAQPPSMAMLAPVM